jgi:hypothetical protein
MDFVYKPEGVEPRRWPFAPYKMLSPEAELIERKTGMAFADFARVVTEGSMLALRALTFVLLKRSDPTLKWDSLQIAMADVDFELDDDEKRDGIKTLEAQAKSQGLNDTEQDLLLTWRADLGLDDEDDRDVEPEADREVVSGQGLPAPVGELAPPAPKA